MQFLLSTILQAEQAIGYTQHSMIAGKFSLCNYLTHPCFTLFSLKSQRRLDRSVQLRSTKKGRPATSTSKKGTFPSAVWQNCNLPAGLRITRALRRTTTRATCPQEQYSGEANRYGN